MARRTLPPQDEANADAVAKLAAELNERGLKPDPHFNATATQSPAPPTFPPLLAYPVDEYKTARLTPPCIVESYLYEDTGLLLGDGGLGKSTVQLFEMIRIINGWNVWGRVVRKPGPCAYITAEDQAERIRGKAWRLMSAMDLSDADRKRTVAGLHIMDLMGEDARLIDADYNPTPLVAHIIDAAAPVAPVVTVLDPLADYIDEENNPDYKALHRVLSQIRLAVGGCVRAVHHVSQAAAKGKDAGQHAARGGTALPNKARMVATITKDRIEGEPGKQLLRISLPKSTYTADQPPIEIVRSGWRFDLYEDATAADAAANLAVEIERLIRYIADNPDEVLSRKSLSSTARHRMALGGMTKDAVQTLCDTAVMQGSIRPERIKGPGGVYRYVVVEPR